MRTETIIYAVLFGGAALAWIVYMFGPKHWHGCEPGESTPTWLLLLLLPGLYAGAMIGLGAMAMVGSILPTLLFVLSPVILVVGTILWLIEVVKERRTAQRERSAQASL